MPAPEDRPIEWGPIESVRSRENLALPGGRQQPTRNGPLDYFFAVVVVVSVFVLVLWGFESWSRLHPAPTPTPIQTSESVNEDVDLAWWTGLPECRTEDSDDCYWDGVRRGNGSGISFYTIDDQTYVIPPNGEPVPACTDLIADLGGICYGEPSSTTTKEN